jgi:hypothetical protein
MNTLRLQLIVATVLVTSVALATTVLGQVTSTTGAIIGTVTDSTKAVVPGVTVRASSPALMGTRTAVTAVDGTYRMPALPPGDYTLVFELMGFGTVTREDIRVGVGFTATVNVDMSPAGVSETLTVSGAAPVVDVVAGKIAVNYDAARIANVLGGRDYWAMLPLLPGVTVSNVDVGGSTAITTQGYRAYGMPGQGRGEIEGMVSNPVTGQEVNYPDMQSFEEMAVTVAGNSAEMPLPGVLTTLSSKSGGNALHGGVYYDYQSEAVEAHNIDAEQLARGVTGGRGRAAIDTNRMEKFRNFNADAGGFFIKDKLWWYGAYKHMHLTQGNVNLIDDVQRTTAPSFSGKLTYNLTENQKVIAYGTRTTKEQDNYFAGATNYSLGGRIYTADTLNLETFPTGVWKFEYAAVLGNNAVAEFRAGDWFYDFLAEPKNQVQRYEDRGNGNVFGSPASQDQILHRRQANGSISYFKDGWAGSHSFKVGSEVMLETSNTFFESFNDMVLVLNNGAPSQVVFYQSPAQSKSNNWIAAVYGSDTWRVSNRVTLNLGLRLDRYHPYVPAQAGPTGQQFERIDGPLWYHLGPRVGVNYDLTGNGKTVVKVNYGQYWQNPRTSFADIFNPNPIKTFETYIWTPANPRIVNGLPAFDEGQQGALVSRAGAQPNGLPTTTVDPDLENVYSRQVTAFVERELFRNFGVRTGVVWNGRRQARGVLNSNQPFDAFNVPVTIRDPGPDAVTGSADDGGTLTAYNLQADRIGQPVVNVVRNLPGVESDYYTWEITANRRQTGGWSLLGSFSYTWTRESPFPIDSTGQVAFTPNALINTVEDRNDYGTWVAKVTGTVQLPWDLQVTPVLRAQKGVPFGRTFIARLNYNSSVTILAEPAGAQSGDNVYVFDTRLQKNIGLNRGLRLGFFCDVYNIFNSNASNSVTASSGTAYLRPNSIIPPRIARFGAKLTF